jgi:cobalt-precorrin-5B (C1)-methyltransferase
MRNGLTTGTCAALAAKAAALSLIEHEQPAKVEVPLPGGDRVEYPVRYLQVAETYAAAAVMKDAGDDPDVTDKALLEVEIKLNQLAENRFFAGPGVGTVTRPGLAIKPGDAAINPVPRLQIAAALKEVTSLGFDVTISVPGGEELALKTFNPRLGIEGGISILGTNGRVRPFSSPALKAALTCALDVAVASEYSELVLVPGHMGNRAALHHFNCSAEQIVDVSNEWGYMFDEMYGLELKQLLLLGHPGKLTKLACGHFQTHSAQSPSPLPWLTELSFKLLGMVPVEPLNTVEEFFMQWLNSEQRRLIADAVAQKIKIRVSETFRLIPEIEVALINLEGEVLGKTAGCDRQWRRHVT